MTTKNKIHAALAIDQYWAIEPRFASSMMESMIEVDASSVLTIGKIPDSEFERSGGDAIIMMSGPMMKGSSSFGDNCDTVATRRRVRAAANDPAVERIILVMDSPGGSVFGTADLAEDVRKAAELKPVIAYIEDLCASACYWVASQCTEIIASPNALAIGSIGVYTVFWDDSKMFEAAGIKPILISSGGEKGKPCRGLPIEDETVASAQDFILQIYERFVETVCEGRNLATEGVLSIADGRVYTAQEALGFGLVDRLASWDDLFDTSATSAVAASEAEGNMKFLDNFKKKAPDTAAVEMPETPQSEAVGHDLEAIDAVVQSAVKGVVTAKVDKFIDTGLLTAASRDAATELLLAAIESDGLELEGNGAIKPGRIQSAVVAFIEGLPKAKLTDPGLAAVDGGRSVMVEEDRFKSMADEYRALAEAETPGMNKVKK